MLISKKKVIILFVILSNFSFVFCENLNSQKNTDEGVHATVSAKCHSKIKGFILSLSDDYTVLQLAKVLKFDLEFTDQISLELKKSDQEPDVKVQAKLFDEGISLSCLLREELSENKKDADDRIIDVTVKEPSSGQILFQKKYHFKNVSFVYDAHVISEDLLPALTGQHGPMLSTLAYCKQLSNKCKAICISDYACKLEKVLYTSQRINLAPRWHSQAPVLFFSQLTRENNRLLSIDLKTNNLRVICSYDGLSMQPSFSEDGTKAVLCMSGRKNSELYLYDQSICRKLKKKVYTQLTNNGENNVSPCYLPSGDVIFCSDFETGQPQIYCLDVKNKKTKRVTNGKGYCAAPSYCKKNNTIVFCRLVSGYFQLFSISLSDKSMAEKQLTFDNTSKQEPTWSECGGYIAFSVDFLHPKNYKNVPQIAVLNLLSMKTKTLTYDDKPKSFPCWIGKTYYN